MNNAVDINELFQSFNGLTALVVGDVMIDSYLWGKAERISPEAPVPIVSVQKRQERLGGAANVALNIQALGATPILCSVIGNDKNGNNFNQLLNTHQLSKEGLIQSETRTTTVKFRIIASHHHMLRVDEEMESDITISEQDLLYNRIESLVNTRKIDVIIFEDYDKGVITTELIKRIVALAVSKGIPTSVDPKKRNFTAYQNVTLFKPNLKELREGLKVDHNPESLSDFVELAKELEGILNNDITLVTLSERGVFVRQHSQDINNIVPAHIRNIADVSGAGDTVISVASLCLALKLHPELIAAIANLAGGLVCEHVGVVSIDKLCLLEESKKLYSKADA